ncbi:hypothetical protein HML84_14560 [Alcanivorax sp. IO_7]|nr:hypothetical protein HML84_14560 [Alcanivorax sp. IO_7]
MVAHFQETLDPDRLDGWLEAELDFLLEQAGGLTLNEVVSADQVLTTARKYAVSTELGGGIPELVGKWWTGSTTTASRKSGASATWWMRPR